MIFTDCKNNNNNALPSKLAKKIAEPAQGLNTSENHCSIVQNSESRATESSANLQNLENDSYLQSLLLDKIVEKFTMQLTPIDSPQLNEQIANFLQKITQIAIEVSRNDGTIAGLCSCFCSAKIKVTFKKKQNANGRALATMESGASHNRSRKKVDCWNKW